MRIGELAKRVGLRASALRYYEALGILAPSRRVSGRREYDPAALNTLRLVRAAQRTGFTLREIGVLLRAAGPRSLSSGAWPALASAKLAQLDDDIARLQTARAALASALGCTCAGTADRCTLVAALPELDPQPDRARKPRHAAPRRRPRQR